MAGIGVGNQGGGDMGAFLKLPEVQYVAVCDVKQSMRDRGKNRVNKQYGNKDCTVYKDFRELLARKDIDAVHIATPDHWHAIITIEACRQGKDVYCQKPESLTIKEGRAMVQAARRYGCVVSGGSQRVLDDHGAVGRKLLERRKGHDQGDIRQLRSAFDALLSAGQAGRRRRGLGHVAGTRALGAVQSVPHRRQLSIDGKSWRSWTDYSGGGMTDWGAHRFGGAMFAAGVADQGPVEIIPPDGKDVKYLTYRFANGLLMYRNPDQKDGIARRGHAGRETAGQDHAQIQGHGRHLRRFPVLRADPRKAVPRHRVGPSHRHRLPPGHHRLRLESALEVGSGQRRVPRRRRGQSLPRSGQARTLANMRMEFRDKDDQD